MNQVDWSVEGAPVKINSYQERIQQLSPKQLLEFRKRKQLTSRKDWEKKYKFNHERRLELTKQRKARSDRCKAKKTPQQLEAKRETSRLNYK